MRHLALALVVILSTAAFAQSQKSRPATESDFSGYWRIVLIPNEVHNSKIKNEQTGYSDPCQFFVHRPDGTWFNVSVANMAGAERSKSECPTTRAAVDAKFASFGKPEFRWRKAPNQDGFFFIGVLASQEPKKAAALLWKADYVLEDTSHSQASSVEFKKGDMIMQLTQRTADNRVAPVWPTILRPVGD